MRTNIRVSLGTYRVPVNRTIVWMRKSWLIQLKESKEACLILREERLGLRRSPQLRLMYLESHGVGHVDWGLVFYIGRHGKSEVRHISNGRARTTQQEVRRRGDRLEQPKRSNYQRLVYI